MSTFEVLFDEIVPAGGQNDWTIPDLDDAYADGYVHLWIVWHGRTEAGSTEERINMQFNGDTGATSYGYALHYGGSGGAGVGADTSDPSIWVGYVEGAGNDANYSGNGEILIPDFGNTYFDKIARCTAGLRYSGIDAYNITGWWNNDAALTSVRLFPAAGQLEEGSRITAYGLKVEAPLNKRISDLSAVTALDGDEEFVLNDGGTSKKITADDLGAAIGGANLLLNAYLEASGSTLNDEFDAGPTIDGAWTLLGTTPDDVSDNDDVPGSLYIRRVDTSAQFTVYYKAAPSTPYTIFTKINGSSQYGNYQRGGALCVLPSSPTTGSNAVIWGLNFNGNPCLNLIKQTVGGSYSGSDGSVAVPYYGHPVWLRWDILTTTTYDAYFSWDGVFWVKFISGGSLGITAANVGLMCSPESSNQDLEVAFECFRCSV